MKMNALAKGTAAMLALVLGAANASADSWKADLGGRASAFSPDASKIVGTPSKDLSSLQDFRGFTYDVASGSLTWLTSYDPTDFLKSGRFNAVNSAGTIVGAVKDPSMRLPEGGGDFFRPGVSRAPSANTGDPISAAAIWTDGKLTILGCPEEVDTFEDSSDGSYALSVSEDGRRVYGGIFRGYMLTGPCRWELQDDGEWEFSYLPFPTGAAAARVSVGQGDVLGGDVSIPQQGDNVVWPCVWVDGQPKAITFQGDFYTRGLGAISPDGRLAAIYAVGTAGPFLGLYDIEKGHLTEIDLPERLYEAKPLAVNNLGDIYLTLSDTDSYQPKLHFYDSMNRQFLAMDYYLSQVSTLNTQPMAVPETMVVSGDGTLIAGTPQWGNSWLVSLDNPRPVCAPAPGHSEMTITSLTEATFSWTGIEALPDGMTLVGYRVDMDGKGLKDFPATELGGEFSVKLPATCGKVVGATVQTVVLNSEGKEATSPMTSPVFDYVSALTELYDFCDFDRDCSVDGLGNIVWNRDYWRAKLLYGNLGEIIDFNVTSADFENRTPYAACYSISPSPWATAFVSHWMDASDAEDFFFDFRYKMDYLNTMDQSLATDFLDVEVATDGVNWQRVARIEAQGLRHSKWYNAHLDLGSLMAGQVFQIRLNANGQGEGQVSWSVDDLNVDCELTAPAPEGLICTLDDSKRPTLHWKNNIGQYDVTHLDNSSYVWDACVGNEGEPLIVAVDFPAQMLKPFVGQYITSLSSFVYDDQTLDDTYNTSGEGILWCDGKELARAPFDVNFDRLTNTTAWFAQPVRIEAGKDYRLGVRIFEYDPNQAPLYYQKGLNHLTGMTDLYSEDEGKSWQRAQAIVTSDTNPQGRCVWPIHANISDSAEPGDSETQDDGELLFWNLYRDGEPLAEGNIYNPHPFLKDEEGGVGSVYTLRAYHKDGAVSPLSQPLTVTDDSGVETIGFCLRVVVSDGEVRLEGGCQGFELVATDGHTVARTETGRLSTAGLPRGAYLLRARTATGAETHKVIL